MTDPHIPQPPQPPTNVQVREDRPLCTREPDLERIVECILTWMVVVFSGISAVFLVALVVAKWWGAQ